MAKKIEVFGGTVETAWQRLRDEAERSGEECYCEFNDKEIRSTDTLDEACVRITGRTKAELDEANRKWKEDYDRRQEEHEARIPQLTEEYRKRARGLVLNEELEYWDEIVPVRLGDIYHGMELDNVLGCCEAMRDETLDREGRLRKAYKIFQDAGHSGWLAGLTMSMLRRFCPDGSELADACNEFRYDEGNPNIFIARNPDGELFLHTTYPHRRDDGTFATPNQRRLNPLQFPNIKKGEKMMYKPVL